MYKSDAAWRLPSRHWDVSVFQGSTQSAHPARPGPNLQFSPRFLAILMATWRPHGTSSDRRICQWPTPRIITEDPPNLAKILRVEHPRPAGSPWPPEPPHLQSSTEILR